MDLDTAASCLAELGYPTRLAIYRLLVRAGDTGLAVGDIQRHLNLAASTLSHHLSHLLQADLITQEREGRTLRCRIRFGTMEDLLAFLTEECCAGTAPVPATTSRKLNRRS